MSDATAVTGLPGIGFTPFETRAELIVSVARTAARLGFVRVPVAEAMGHVSPVLLAEIVTQPERVELRKPLCPSGPTISASVPLAVGPDRTAAERMAARWLTVYCTRMGPI